MSGIESARGILYPERLPTFHRLPAPPSLGDVVRWFWIPQWDLAPGETSRQQVLPFPASNLVIGPERVTLSGPTTRISHRDLRGSGWAVGALLRPAGLAALHPDPRRIRDTEIVVDAPELFRDVSAAMSPTAADSARRDAVAACASWLAARVRTDDNGAVANAMERAVEADPRIVRVDDLARRIHVSPRTVQRLARRYIGLPPLAVIRRYRLQDAAGRLRADPALSVARVAAELGYADHAHLTRDFQHALGMTPNAYRRAEG